MDEDINYSDEEISEKEHSRLLEAVSKLDKSQHIRKPTRTEPSLQISEYNLVKSSAGKNSTVNLHNLVKVLNKKSSQIDITKKINKVRRNVKTIPKPLEKPEAQKIQRTVAYENVKKTLDKWEPIVYANRAAEQLEFPLRKDPKLKPVETTTDLLQRFRLKSEIELEMEKLQPEKPKEEVKSEFPLTLAEMLERRKEAAKLRAQQSYKEAKARRQNKIKSKKYHRIQRREKIKQQIKEFEFLQKNNPEEALKKLEEIERARAEERVSLRHRSTGQWAKSKQVRAKYDKESRQVLAQQLSVSRDLTQKIKKSVDDDSDNEEEQINEIHSTSEDPSNPWINGIKPSSEVTDFLSGYRKYWNEKNKTQINVSNSKPREENKFTEVSSTTLENDDQIMNEEIDEDEIDIFKSKINDLNETEKRKTPKKTVAKTCKKNNKKINVTSTVNGWSVEEIDETLNVKNEDSLKKKKKLKDSNQEPSKKKTKVKQPSEEIQKKKRVKPPAEETEKKKKTVKSKLPESQKGTIDDIFEDIDFKLEKKLKKRVQNIKNLNDSSQSEKKEKNEPKSKYKPDLSLKSQRQMRPDLDEALIETAGDTSKPAVIKTSPQVQVEKSDDKVPDIDPTSFVQIEPKHLKTKISTNQNLDDALDDEDGVEEDTQQALISEAFEDDDIIADFHKEKKDEVDANTPKDIDLSLPGWGSWGGKNIKKRKSRRFIIKQPKKVPRKDDNKGNLIVKEHKDIKVREHQVNDLPFPFKRVEDFEASIRAPLGNTFLPETAHKRLVKPSVTIKTGAIIEPMDDSQLVLNKIRKLKKGIL